MGADAYADGKEYAHDSDECNHKSVNRKDHAERHAPVVRAAIIPYPVEQRRQVHQVRVLLEQRVSVSYNKEKDGKN